MTNPTEHKVWRFTAPGAPDGQEIVVDTREPVSVRDILNKLGTPEVPAWNRRSSARKKNKTGIILPFVRRTPGSRRHPSA